LCSRSDLRAEQIAEEFLAEYARAKTTFEASLPDSAAPIGPDNRPKIRSAILTFLSKIEDQNARFLRAALEAYQDELDNQLRKKNVMPATGGLVKAASPE
jgi:hypothetical protein